MIWGGVNIGQDGIRTLNDITPSDGIVMLGLNERDFTGASVSSAGDLNADGYPDIAVGAPADDYLNPTVQGKVYIVFGGPGIGSTGTIDLSSLNGTNGFVINAPEDDGFVDATGCSVASAGDFNDDGYSDLVIGKLLYPCGHALLPAVIADYPSPS